MSDLPPGVTSTRISTDRVEMHTLRSGPDDGVPVVFVHGNVSSGRFFAELMARLPDTVTAWAPDLRGFGQTDRPPSTPPGACATSPTTCAPS